VSKAAAQSALFQVHLRYRSLTETLPDFAVISQSKIVTSSELPLTTF
jgi:hypothetical protein